MSEITWVRADHPAVLPVCELTVAFVVLSFVSWQRKITIVIVQIILSYVTRSVVMWFVWWLLNPNSNYYSFSQHAIKPTGVIPLSSGWWHTSLIPVLRRQKQVDLCELETIPVYKSTPRPARLFRETLFQKKERKKKSRTLPSIQL